MCCSARSRPSPSPAASSSPWSSPAAAAYARHGSRRPSCAAAALFDARDPPKTSGAAAGAAHAHACRPPRRVGIQAKLFTLEDEWSMLKLRAQARSRSLSPHLATTSHDLP